MNNNKRQAALKMGMILGEGLGVYELDKLMTKLKSLARAHHRQCENACNGEGYVGRTYYGFCHRDGSHDEVPENTFENEIERIENTLESLARSVNLGAAWEVQHDPRGATVRLTIAGYTFCPAFDF